MECYSIILRKVTPYSVLDWSLPPSPNLLLNTDRYYQITQSRLNADCHNNVRAPYKMLVVPFH